MQLFDEDFADEFAFDVLDATKIIPEEEVPVRHRRPAGARPLRRQLLRRDRAGRVLHQNIVPGIDFTNDPLLQGRNFSYLDTQLKRLGSPNFTHLPVNAPRCPFAPLPAGRPHGDAQPEGPGELRAELLGRATAARARIPQRGFRTLPGRGGRRASCASAARLRRPLQPGAAVLRQPDRRSSRSTSRDALRLRAQQGRDARRSARAWSRTCSTSTRSLRADGRRRPRA